MTQIPFKRGGARGRTLQGASCTQDMYTDLYGAGPARLWQRRLRYKCSGLLRQVLGNCRLRCMVRAVIIIQDAWFPH